MDETKETCSWEQLAKDKAYLQRQLEQLRLEQAKDRTRVYQTPGDGVEIDMFIFAFKRGWDSGGLAQLEDEYQVTPITDELITSKLNEAIEAWKESQ